MDHLLGVNQFFIDLYAHARHNHDAELMVWWSEQHATAAFRSARSQIRPDGHGIWRTADTHVGFFLEHDRGTEDLPRVVRKLAQYEKLVADGGPRYPVLLRVPDRRREANLLRILAGVATAMPVATAIHSSRPAEPVWATPGTPAIRRHLHELSNYPVRDDIHRS